LLASRKRCQRSTGSRRSAPGTAVPTLDTHLHGSSRSVSGCANARPRKASDVIPSRSHDPYCRRSLLPPSNACLPKKRPADQRPAGRPHVFSGVEVSLGRRASVLGTSPGRAGCRGCSGGASRLTTRGSAVSLQQSQFRVGPHITSFSVPDPWVLHSAGPAHNLERIFYAILHLKTGCSDSCDHVCERRCSRIKQQKPKRRPNRSSPVGTFKRSRSKQPFRRRAVR
jgi:hypothetical protein